MELFDNLMLGFTVAFTPRTCCTRCWAASWAP